MQVHHRQRLSRGRRHHRLRVSGLLRLRPRAQVRGHLVDRLPRDSFVPKSVGRGGRVPLFVPAGGGQELAHVRPAGGKLQPIYGWLQNKPTQTTTCS